MGESLGLRLGFSCMFAGSLQVRCSKKGFGFRVGGLSRVFGYPQVMWMRQASHLLVPNNALCRRQQQP